MTEDLKKETQSEVLLLEKMNERPKMKYFRKFIDANSIRMQQKKGYHADRLVINDKYTLEFLKRKEIGNPSFWNLIEQFNAQSSGLRYLRKLQLKGPKNKKFCLEDREAQILATRIRTRFKALKNLDLDFRGSPQISDKGLKGITKLIRNNHKTLHNLHLNFEFCKKITDRSFKSLVNQIRTHRRKIEELFLCLWQARISKTLFQKAVDWITKNLKNLRSLGLIFSDTREKNEVDDSDLKTAVLLIGARLKALENLYLNYSVSSKITDNGFQALARQIGQNIQNLQNLKLSFFNCQLTDHSIETLAKQIRNYKFLRKLHLNFHAIPKLTTNGTDALIKSIELYCQQLRHLDIWFNCRISAKAKETLEVLRTDQNLDFFIRKKAH